MSQLSFRGQGTIEYLLVIAVIIVIALVVVSMLFLVSGPPSAQISSSSERLVGGVSVISFTEGVVDTDGNGLILLQNNVGENIRITSISAGGSDNNYPEEMIAFGDARVFSFEGLGGSCLCSSGETKKSCSFVVNYITGTGLSKTLVVQTSIDCVSSAIAKDENKVVNQTNCSFDDIGCSGTNYLTCGSNNFWVNNGDINGYCGYSPVCFSGQTSCDGMDYLTCDNNYSWTNNGGVEGYCDYSPLLLCWDSGTSPHPLCNCHDLNKVRDHLDWSYILTDDIDCSATVDWNNNTGFGAIGGTSSGTFFTGDLNGAGHTITGLYYSGSGNASLFNLCSSAYISNLGLVDVNINSSTSTATSFCNQLRNGSVLENSYATGDINGRWAAGLSGVLYESGTMIKNSYFSGNVRGYSGAGGIVGGINSATMIINSYSDGNVTTTPLAWNWTGQVGGIVATTDGGVNGAPYAYILNSYSSANVSGNYKTGGLVGHSGGTVIQNSFATGAISGNTAWKNGLVGFNQALYLLSNNYWDVYRTGMSSCGWTGDSCIGVNSGNSDPTYFYISSNPPLNDLNWNLSADVNWSICEGQGLPWLSWENRSC